MPSARSTSPTSRAHSGSLVHFRPGAHALRALAGLAGLAFLLLAAPGFAAPAVPAAAFQRADADTFTLTYTAGAHGSITGDSPQRVASGESGAAVTAVADAGWHFTGWSDGVLTAARTDTSVTADLSVTANFAIDTHTITASAGANGAISPSGAVSVDDGSDQAFTITPDAGFVVLDVLVDGVSAGPVTGHTFTNVTADHTISATFTPELTPAVVGAGSPSGTLAPGTDSLLVPVTIARTYANSNRLFHVKFQLSGGLVLPSGTASVTEGTFLSGGGGTTQFQVVDEGGGVYSVDGTVLGAPCDVTALSGNLFNIEVGSAAAGGPGAVTITEVTLRDCNNDPLPASIGSAASVAIDHAGPSLSLTSPNGGFVAVGSTQAITWTASDAAGVAGVDLAYSTDGGATYPNVIATGLSNTGSHDWTVPNTVSTTARVRVTATDAFGNASADASDADVTIGRYTLSVATAGTGSGTVTKDPDEADYASGTSVSLTAVPAASSDFTGWSGDLAGAANPSPLTMDGDRAVTATFTLKTFTITASATGNGTISPAGVTTHDYGATPGFTLTPATGWHVQDLKVDGVSVGAVASYTFAALTSSHTIDASFAIDTHTLTYTAAAHGSISGSTPQVVPYGSDGTVVTAVPDAGWHFAGWSDGVMTAARQETNVTADLAVTATFAVDTHTLTYAAGAHGSITGMTPQIVPYGSSGTAVTAVADEGWHFTSWSDGVLTATRQETNVTADLSVTASFAINTYTLTYLAGPNGSISGVSPQTVQHGANGSTVTAVANAAHHFTSWSDGVTTAARTDLAVTASLTVTASFAANPAVPPITALAATQVKTANDADGTTRVTISWPALPAGSTVQVWRAPFGNYPEYDDPTPVPGAVPGLPSGTPSAPWVLTDVTASGQTDEVATRDIWYYVAIVTDLYGTVSPVSNLAGGVLNYHLGDVTNGVTPGTGNNSVDIADVSLLGAHYGISGAAVNAWNYLDVGPTTNRTTDGRPLTDNRIDFEDLVMFAINYMSVSAPQSSAHPALVAASADELRLDVPSTAGTGGPVVARLGMQGTGAVQGFSARLAWDPSVVRFASAAPAEMVDELGAVLLSGEPGVVDVARLGAGGLAGEGAIANVVFERVGPGDPNIRIETVLARGSANQSVAIVYRNERLPVVPSVTALGRIAPNPFRANASLAFDLARPGPVDLTVYSVDGRVVRHLVRGARDAGAYRVAWDGRGDDGSPVAAGVYYARLVTEQGRFSRSLVYLK